MPGRRDGRRGEAAGEQKTHLKSHLKRGNLQHRHGRKIEKKHISTRKLEQMGLGACKERQGWRLVNAWTAKPGFAPLPSTRISEQISAVLPFQTPFPGVKHSGGWRNSEQFPTHMSLSRLQAVLKMDTPAGICCVQRQHNYLPLSSPLLQRGGGRKR